MIGRRKRDGAGDGGRAARAAAVAIAAALAGVPGAAAAKDPISIGMAVALTGYLASYDGQFIDGVKLAAREANAAGGIDGHKLDLHIVDDASNATTGVTVTNQLLNRFGVTVMLNGLSSAQNQAIEPILERAKVPQITFSVLPQNPKWAFLANLLNERADALQIDFAAKSVHAKKVAIVFSQTPYGQTAAKFMSARAAKDGMQVVYSQAVEPSVTDMTPQMAALKATGPDVVVDVLTGSTHIVEAKAAATVGLGVPIVMATDDLPTHQKADTAYPQSFFVTTAVQAYPNIDNPATKAACASFIATYKKAGDDLSTISGASFGWDAVHILAMAVQSSGATGGDALFAGFEKTTYQGCNTLYRYSASDHSGQMDVPNELRISRLKDGAVDVVFTERDLKISEN